MTKQVVQALTLEVQGAHEAGGCQNGGCQNGEKQEAQKGARTTNRWAVYDDLPAISTAEILGHHNALVLVAIRDPQDLIEPLEKAWEVGRLGDVLSCRNAAAIRVPPAENPTEEDYRTARRDLATAITRCLLGDYEYAAFDPELLTNKDARFRALIESAQVFRGGLDVDGATTATTFPPFMSEFDLRELWAAHQAQFEVPGMREVGYMAVGCGIGGGALGAIGAGASKTGMVLNDICPKHCAELERRFPNATVICGDFSDAAVQRRLLEHRDNVVLMEASLNCQPSSDARDDHNADDIRHKINPVIVQLAAKVRPQVLVVEDVVGFRHNQPEQFEKFQKGLEEVFDTVRVVVCNARDAMVQW